MTNTNTSRKDNSPYQIDNSVYKRFDARNALFSRFAWDTEYAAKMAKVRKLYKDSDPGYSHLDSALVEGHSLVVSRMNRWRRIQANIPACYPLKTNP